MRGTDTTDHTISPNGPALVYFDSRGGIWHIDLPDGTLADALPPEEVANP
jgi:hypothetical protein